MNQNSRLSFGLEWLNEHEDLLKESHSGTSSRKLVEGSPLGNLPAHLSDEWRQRILKGIVRLREALESSIAGRQHEILTMSSAQLCEIVYAAIELAGDFAEYIVVDMTCEKYVAGAEHIARLRRSREIAIEKRRAISLSRHAGWRSEAKEIWDTQPRLSVKACASRVIKRLQSTAKPKTVEDVIRNLRPRLTRQLA